MAKKNTSISESVASGAATARAEGGKPSRAKTSKHSKAQLVVPAVSNAAPSTPIFASAQEEVSLVAYLYSEARGFQGGSQEEDWLRAEQEVRARRSK